MNEIFPQGLKSREEELKGNLWNRILIQSANLLEVMLSAILLSADLF